METPSQKLAAKIVERLISENLISADAGKKLQGLLAEGKLRAEDWQVPIELEIVKRVNHESQEAQDRAPARIGNPFFPGV